MTKRARGHSTARRTNRDYPRTARLNRLFQEILAEELERIDDDRLELVTVMAVDCDADLGRAIVFYESLGGADDDDEVLEALRRAAPSPAVGHRPPDPREAHARADLPARRRRRAARRASKRCCATSTTPTDGSTRRAGRTRRARGGRQGGRVDEPRRRRQGPRPARHPQGRPLRHPRSRRHRRAAPRRGQGHPAAALPRPPGEDLHGRGGARHGRPRRSTRRGDVTGTWDMAGVRRADVQAAGRAPHRRHPAGAADGVGHPDRRPPAPRAGSGGHRGRARGPAGHRAPLHGRARSPSPGTSRSR